MNDEHEADNDPTFRMKMFHQKCSTMDQNDGKVKKSPVRSAEKLQLLLQRSVRYSYRKRCCWCCPTILCEMLIPTLFIILFVYSWFSVNDTVRKLHGSHPVFMSTNQPAVCSQNLTVPPTSSDEIRAKCFRFPSDYIADVFRFSSNDRVVPIDFIFQPISNDTLALAQRARQKLIGMGCGHVQTR